MTHIRRVQRTASFEKDIKRMEKRGKDIEKLKTLARILVTNGLPLPAVYKDHPLRGNFVGCRDAHIEPDWILIYRFNDTLVKFERTGTHSDLF